MKQKQHGNHTVQVTYADLESFKVLLYDNSFSTFSRLRVAGRVKYQKPMMWLFTFGFLIAVTGTPVGATCPVEFSPSSVVVGYGDSFSTNCTSPSNVTLGMGWESQIDGIPFTEGVSFLTLKIDLVNLWDLSPMCFITGKDQEQCYKPLPIIVYKLPDSVSMSDISEGRPLIAGTTYKFQCHIIDVAPAKYLAVYWHAGHKIISMQTFSDTSPSPVNKTSEVSWTPDKDDNGALVWCEAKLNVMPTGASLPSTMSRTQRVSVLYAPTFDQPQNETLEETKRDVYLNCTAKGNPKPVFTWQFPRPLEPLEEQKTKNALTLDRFLQFPGTYICTASNSEGSAIKYFTIVKAPRNRTTFAAIVGSFSCLAVVLLIAGLFFVQPDGTFSLSKGNYLRGRPV